MYTKQALLVLFTLTVLMVIKFSINFPPVTITPKSTPPFRNMDDLPELLSSRSSRDDLLTKIYSYLHQKEPDDITEVILSPDNKQASRIQGLNSSPLWLNGKLYQGPPLMNSNAQTLRGDLVTSSVHYFWCKKDYFYFGNYLSMLSVVRVIQPLRIVFHYTEMPLKDDYNNWFNDLQTLLPNLELHKLGDQTCDNPSKRTDVIFDIVGKTGGIYVGESVIVNNFTTKDWEDDSLQIWERPAANKFNGVATFNANKPEPSLNKRREMNTRKCCVEEGFEVHQRECQAVILKNVAFSPKDIFTSDSKFSEQLRWLAYNTKRKLIPISDDSNKAPRIGHFIWFGDRQFGFANALSVLSSLYVAGLTRCYFHGDTRPHGVYWNILEQTHQVTFIYMDVTRWIYNQSMRIPQHTADVAKAYILLKYGGLTQDSDVFWVKRIPDELFAFETVLSNDWPKRKNWPETFNLGIIISKTNSKFLAEFVTTYRKNYFPYIWDYNPIRMPYRAYERHPESVNVYPHLQVMIWGSSSHPTWVKDYIQPLNVLSKGHPFNWKEDTLSVHITWPKYISALKNFKTLMTGTLLYNSIGRFILDNCPSSILNEFLQIEETQKL